VSETDDAPTDAAADEARPPAGDRGFLSIGEVLDLLKGEYPDVTISKIRFLESQGLINPERTPSGYRKFHQPEIDRLRWILHQQRDNFLPLKVIKEKLEAQADQGLPAPAMPSPADQAAVVERGEPEQPGDAGEARSREPAQDQPPEQRSQPADREPEQGSRPASQEQGGRPAAQEQGSRPGPHEQGGPPEVQAREEPEEPSPPAEAPAPVQQALDDGPTAGPGEPSAPEPPVQEPPAVSAAEATAAAVADGAVEPPPGEVPGSGPEEAEPAGPAPQAGEAEQAEPAPQAGEAEQAAPAPQAGEAEQAAPAPQEAAPASGREQAQEEQEQAPPEREQAPPARRAPRAGGPSKRRRRADNGPLTEELTTASLTREELLSASGLSEHQLGELERFGLLESRSVTGTESFDGDALVVARLAATFAGHGVEARHLRMYKMAADREAGFYEQVVMPMAKQRNPAVRRQARETLVELARLGESMRNALLRASLRDHTEGR
jgi:DNA-binding transcriptional MerR regulator